MTERSTLSDTRDTGTVTPIPKGWWIALYAAAAILGYGCGLGVFYGWGAFFFEYFGSEYDATWRFAAGAAGVVLTVALAAWIDRETGALRRVLLAAHAAMPGAWPWQTVRGWWIPFAVTIPMAAVTPLIGLHFLLVNQPPADVDTWVDTLLTVGALALAAYIQQIPFPLLAVYGAAHGRPWLKWIGRYLVGGYWCFVALCLGAAYAQGWPGYTYAFSGGRFWCSAAAPVMAILLGIPALFLWRCFTREASLPPQEPPPLHALSPWKLRDATVLLAIPVGQFLSVLTVLSVRPFSIDRLWTNLVMALVVVVIVVRRKRLRALLLGDMPARMTAKSAFTTATLYVLALVPVVFLVDPHSVERFLAQFLDPGRSWNELCLLILVAPIGEELAFRGVLFDYWTRSFGAARSCVLTASTFLCMHSGYLLWPGFPPATLAYYAIVSLVLTVLRLRTGAVLPCIFAHAGLNYFASF